MDINVPESVHAALSDYMPLPVKQAPPNTKPVTLEYKNKYILHRRLLKTSLIRPGCNEGLSC